MIGRRLGHTQVIDGERCTLFGYSTAGRPRFRRPDGSSVTPKPRRRPRRARAPALYARVRVKVAGRYYRGLVAKRSPLRFRITEPGELKGQTIDRTQYFLEANWL